MMHNGGFRVGFDRHEGARSDKFGDVWSSELNDAFKDIAKYYDKANHVASLGMWNWFLSNFLSIIDFQPEQKVLDVCAGTNAIGLALLREHPDLDVTAMDRSEAMQKVGRKSAERLGNRIASVIGDAHHLPFPDNHFDIVTLQWASRHLRVQDVLCEVKRVLRPEGSFYHCDMLRPNNRFVEKAYYTYLWACLEITSRIFASGSPALRQKAYFIDTLSMFYSAPELTEMLEYLGFKQVSEKTVLSGMVGFHKAMKE